MENVQDNSDGYTEAWYLPNATNIEEYQPVSCSFFGSKHCMTRHACMACWLGWHKSMDVTVL
jgi:hypothetical protein